MQVNRKKKPVFLWGIPRSVSTAFEKMMAYSGCFDVKSEPFIDIYKQSLRSDAESESANQAFQVICQTMTEQSRKQPLFVKDMAYHAQPFLTDDFIGSIQNTFLIRDPSLTIPSLYRMRPEYTEDQPGFEAQYHLFKRVHELTGSPPFVLDGEDLKQNAESIVSAYFRYIDCELPTDILHWPVGSREAWVGRESWHLDAIKSTGFEALQKDVDFKELPDRVLKSIERNRDYYEQMREYLSTNKI